MSILSLMQAMGEPPRQPKMRKYPLNHCWLFDNGDDLKLAAAHAALYVDVKHAFDQLRLAHVLNVFI